MKQIATIVPRSSETGEYVPTHGTKVVLADGTELAGVTNIQIYGGMNDIWRARIDCLVNLQAMPGVAIEVNQPGITVTWWRRLLLRLAGVEYLNVTTLQSKDVEYASV